MDGLDESHDSGSTESRKGPFLSETVLLCGTKLRGCFENVSTGSNFEMSSKFFR